MLLAYQLHLVVFRRVVQSFVHLIVLVNNKKCSLLGITSILRKGQPQSKLTILNFLGINALLPPSWHQDSDKYLIMIASPIYFHHVPWEHFTTLPLKGNKDVHNVLQVCCRLLYNQCSDLRGANLKKREA